MSLIITRNQDGTFCLLKDGSPINDKSYYLINRLNNNSNYYLLWPNEKCFYLYNQLNGEFARNSRNDLDADLFREIRHYSQRTKSFAAYRSDSSQAHLIYENGDIPKDVFIEIGAESNDESCSRPVKYIYSGRRWCFYNTRNQQFIWPKGSGYKLDDDQVLCSRFDNGFFSIYHSEQEVYQLAFYDRGKTYPYVVATEDGSKVKRQGHLFFFEERFNLIQPHGNFLICKAKNGIYHVFNTLAKNKNRRLCASVDEPKFSNDYIFISSERTKQVFSIRQNRTIENDTWKRDCDINVCREYVFVKNPGENSWKIYRLKDAHEVYTDLDIVDVEVKRDNVSCKVKDQYGNTETYNIEDITQFNKQWLQRMSALLNENQKQIETVSTVKEETIPAETQTKPGFPDHIDFVISTKVNIRPQSYDVIKITKKTSDLRPNDIILFYDEEINKVFIARFLHKTFFILHSKQLLTHLSFASSVSNKFTSCSVDGLTEGNYLEKIKSVLVKEDIRKSSISIDKKHKEITAFLKKKEYNFSEDVIQRVLQVLLPDYFEKEKEIKKLLSATFAFKDVEYSLRPDEVWQVDDPFQRRRFLDKKDYIAVLVDTNARFKVGSRLPGAHYEMEGEGKEGNQSYESPSRKINTNGFIRDNAKRILLFKKVDNTIVFFDEVECIDSREEQEYYGDYSRIIIKFFLRSKIREFTK